MIDLPRISTASTRERVQAVLDAPCGGYLCDDGSAGVFRRRLTANGVVTVHIQCASCGRSRSGALKRNDFPFWQDFSLWDDGLAAAHEVRLKERFHSVRTEQASHSESQIADRIRRREEYRVWLATSLEWKDLRTRVMARAGRLCEACLIASASDVHHLTYHLGRLPPAWELRAVCRVCHDRLHDWTGGEG